jgi:hypothetical protein
LTSRTSATSGYVTRLLRPYDPHVPEDAIFLYDQAWNAAESATRERLLEQSLTADADLVDPLAGRVRGRDAISQRIAGFTERFPGARVTITSGVDEHNSFARYAWTISASDGSTILDGVDVVARADDQRIKQIVMFFGPLPTVDERH